MPGYAHPAMPDESPKQPPASAPQGEGNAEAIALDHAQDVFLASTEGVMRFGEHSIPFKFVHDPHDGRLIASAPVAALLAADLVLSAPEESDDALQLLLSPDEIEESASTDRWLVYHGDPPHVRWGAFWVDGVRHGPWVFDGDAIALPNPLHAIEPALCKRLNADQTGLAALCQRFAGMVVPSPVCVGVDPRGLHVRARFGVIRVRFEAPIDVPDDAPAILEEMLAQASKL